MNAAEYLQVLKTHSDAIQWRPSMDSIALISVGARMKQSPACTPLGTPRNIVYLAQEVVLSHSVSQLRSRIKCERRTCSLGDMSQAWVFKNSDIGAEHTSFAILQREMKIGRKELFVLHNCSQNTSHHLRHTFWICHRQLCLQHRCCWACMWASNMYFVPVQEAPEQKANWPDRSTEPSALWQIWTLLGNGNCFHVFAHFPRTISVCSVVHFEW